MRRRRAQPRTQGTDGPADRNALDLKDEQLDRRQDFLSDERIADTVVDVLCYRSDDPAEDRRHVDVQVRDGTVEPGGYTRTERSSAAIEALVRGLDGVLGVPNNVTSFETLARGSSQAAERRPK
jgi:hypothetical protein